MSVEITTAELLRERLNELRPADTFELGMYRLLAWADTRGSIDGYHLDRLADWRDILTDIAARLDEAATR